MMKTYQHNIVHALFAMMILTIPAWSGLAAPVDFERDIKPIFQEHCIKCHGPKKQKASLRLDQPAAMLRSGDSGEPTIKTGKPEESYLIEVLTDPDPEFRMPPESDPIPDAQLALIKRWIKEGAKMPGNAAPKKLTTDHWSYQPIKKVTPPKIDDKFVKNPIDAFVLRKLTENKLGPTYRADRKTLIRRIYLDMLGLLPSPKRVEAFVNDKRPDAYERLVEEVLASPHYGERWARHWLDAVRFAESNGFETNYERPNAYHYRDYVIRALNSDKPYNEFVFEQIAGDAVGADAATGFIVGGPMDAVKSPDIVLTSMQRQDELTDMANTTGTAFLAITMACARCHNHKFDPITVNDFYSFQAAFAGVRHGERTVNTSVKPEVKDKIARLEKEINQLEAELTQYQPNVYPGQIIYIDDEDPQSTQMLTEKRGHGSNPEGTQPGYRDDPGSATRTPNLSQSKYTYWNNKADQDMFAYKPNADGRYQVFVSYGVGHDSHTTNAQYILDKDGDTKTKDDQTRIGVVNQQQLAYKQFKRVPEKSLWSGFNYLGTHELNSKSIIILRGSDQGQAITADAIMLQEAIARPITSTVTNSSSANKPANEPRLHVLEPVNAKRNTEIFEPVPAKHLRFTILRTNNGIEPCIDELEVWTTGDDPKNIALATNGTKVKSSGDYEGNPSHKLSHIIDGQNGNTKSWISNTNNKGWVELTFAEEVDVNKIVWGRDAQSQYTDRTPVEYRFEVSTDGKNWTTVSDHTRRVPFGVGVNDSSYYRAVGLTPDKQTRATTVAKELSRKQNELAPLTAQKKMYSGNFVNPEPIHRLYRGDPMAKRERVAVSSIEVLEDQVGQFKLDLDAPEQKRRVTLAKWIASDKNPLTPRVIVNRLWHHHFGKGIVNTPSDFGKMGAKPTHPELLDWLAIQLIENGWSLKHIHRLILTSNTYQQSSHPCPDCMEADAGTTLLWRYPPRRLEAEAIRDNILLVNGNLDETMYGPGFMLFHPNSNYARNWIAKDKFGPAEYRRMVYALKLRMEQDAVFGAFDCPDGGQTMPKRPISTTPIQALNLFNSPFVMQQANDLANRAKTETNNVSEAIARIYELCYLRDPSQEELSMSVQFVSEHGLQNFARAILNSNEFLFLR